MMLVMICSTILVNYSAGNRIGNTVFFIQFQDINLRWYFLSLIKLYNFSKIFLSGVTVVGVAIPESEKNADSTKFWKYFVSGVIF